MRKLGFQLVRPLEARVGLGRLRHAPKPAASAGFGAGLLVNYVFHSRVTFNTTASPANFTRYLCVVGVNYLLTIGCVALAEANFDNPLLGKLLSLPLVAVNGYLLSKYWIFK